MRTAKLSGAAASLALLCLLALAACRHVPTANEALVRVRNASTVRLNSVTIQFTGAVHQLGDLEPGEVTAYRSGGTAYRYGRVEAAVNGERLVLQPQDYVGETPLRPGRYTYELSLDASGRALQLQFREDR
jgi:hypothetical protein